MTFRPRRRRLGSSLVRALAIGLGATVACSLSTDLTGFSGGEAPDAGLDAANADANAAVDSAGDATADGTPQGCRTTTFIDTPLTANLGSWTPRSYRQADGYPKVEPFFGESAAVLFPFVDTTPIPIDAGSPDAGPTFYVPPERDDSVGGIWQATPVALRAFDVELEFFVKCTTAKSCADGVVFAWLDTPSVATPSMLNVGHVMGLPEGVSGSAVFIDNYQNKPEDTDDPVTPCLAIVQLDASKPIGKYAWVTASKPTPFLGAWHKLSISLRDTALKVGYDGAPSFAGTVQPLVRGIIGITAGTGGQTDAVAIRNVKASFYDCAPP